jgi:DNA-binding NtrC family response regulator
MKTLTKDAVMADKNTQTVAVFDDDQSICKTIQLLVEKRGMVCVSANTVPEAAFEIGRSKPDIIITDFEFQHDFNIALLAEHLAKSADKVIILTAGDPEEILKKYPSLSFAKFIKKGMPLRKVIEEISA